MVVAPVLANILKYGFLGLVVTGAGFLIAKVAVMVKHQNEAIEDLIYREQISTVDDSINLDKNALKCLTHPNTPFCLLSSNRKLELLRSRHLAPTTDIPPDNAIVQLKPHSPHPIYIMLEHFKNIMNSLSVTAILLEPSILFCMLPPLQKYVLVSNEFNTSILQGSPHVVAFGIFEKESTVLNEESSTRILLDAGFEISRARKWFEISAKDKSVGDFFTTDFLLTRQNLTVHIIVFFQRESFMWHPAVSNWDFHFQPRSLGRNAIYENFTAVPIPLENGEESGFYYPSPLNDFIQQIQYSEFVDCGSSQQAESHPQLHPSLTNEQLNHRVQITIQELKLRFKPIVAHFWIWKDTLTGWREDCNLFQTTYEFNLGIRASVMAKVNLNETFSVNQYLRLIENHLWEDLQHKLVLDCYGLQINIFTFYEDSYHIWYYEGNSGGHLIRITYSKFRLCSTSVMGQLVHVPCEKTLKREYGNI